MHYISNLNIENNLTNNSFSPTVTKATTTLNGGIALSSLSSFAHIISGTATGFTITLPDATTLTNGWKFEFFNTSSQTISILYKNASILANLLPSAYLALTLEDNTTVNGSWIRWGTFTGGTATGILHYDVSSSTTFSLTAGTEDTVITGMTVTPAQGEYSIWYQGSIEITGNNTVVRTTLYKDSLIIAESLRTIRSSVSSFFTIHTTSSITLFNGSEVLTVRVARNNNSLSVQSRSLIMLRLGDGT